MNNQKLTFRKVYTAIEEQLKKHCGEALYVKRQRGKGCYGWAGPISGVAFDYKTGLVMEKEESLPKMHIPPHFATDESQLAKIAEWFAITCRTSRPLGNLWDLSDREEEN